MYYQFVYNNLCEDRKSLKQKYNYGSNLHKHHIIPKHSDGLDEDSNYTYLTIREHIIAHFLLWKIYKNPNDLRAMKMLGAKLTFEQRQIVGKWCRDNKIGFHRAASEQKTEWRNKGIVTQITNKIGIHNPVNYQKNASLGGKFGSLSQITNKIGIHNPDNYRKNASLGGKSLKGMICVTNGTHRTRIKPEKLEEYLSMGYKKGFTLFS